MSMTETIDKIEAQQTLRTTLEKRILAYFYEEGAWHDDGSMVTEDSHLRAMIPELVNLLFNTMFVPEHLRDLPYRAIVEQATKHALRHAREK